MDKTTEMLTQLMQTVNQLFRTVNDMREENNKRWDANDKKWEENEKRWKENEKRWEENEKRWEEYKNDREVDREAIQGILWSFQTSVEKMHKENADKIEELREQLKAVNV